MKLKAEGCTIELEIVHDKERRWFRTGMVDLMLNGDLLMRAHIAHVTPVYQMLRDNLRANSISLIESNGDVSVGVPKGRSAVTGRMSLPTGLVNDNLPKRPGEGNGLVTAQRSYITDIADDPPKVEPRTIDGKIVAVDLIDPEQFMRAMRNYLPPDQRTPSWREIGVQYGYPVCCIDAFVNLEHIKHPQPLKLDGTGYIPCEFCNGLYTEQEMADRINALRYKCLKPFTTNRMDHIECEEG